MCYTLHSSTYFGSKHAKQVAQQYTCAHLSKTVEFDATSVVAQKRRPPLAGLDFQRRPSHWPRAEVRCNPMTIDILRIAFLHRWAHTVFHAMCRYVRCSKSS